MWELNVTIDLRHLRCYLYTNIKSRWFLNFLKTNKKFSSKIYFESKNCKKPADVSLFLSRSLSLLDTDEKSKTQRPESNKKWLIQNKGPKREQILRTQKKIFVKMKEKKLRKFYEASERDNSFEIKVRNI